jgi:signal transduction histidine kinase
MAQTEIIIFIVLINIVLIAFIAGIVVFIAQYRKKKAKYEKEKAAMREMHQLELLQTRLDIQHQTMQHIGTEIHDSVGQKLTLASIYTNHLAHKNQFPEQTEQIIEVGKIINESLQELRLLSKTLNDPRLAQADLLSLVNEEATTVNASGVCFVAVESNIQSYNMPPREKNVLFRIIQEGIQNCLKHAQCKRIEIHLKMEDNLFTLAVIDDGKGFDMDVAPKGMGLNNMRRRAQQIGATWRLDSKQGKGTRIALSLLFEK